MSLGECFYNFKMKYIYPCVMKIKLCCIDKESKEYIKKNYKNKTIGDLKCSPISQQIVPLLVRYDKDFEKFRL